MAVLRGILDPAVIKIVEEARGGQRQVSRDFPLELIRFLESGNEIRRRELKKVQTIAK